jgi:glutathione S-transferase kappa 1
VIEQALTDLGLSKLQIQQLFQRSVQRSVKETLQTKTQEALSLGAFGAPFFVVQDQVFFGSDRFEQLAVLLNQPWLGVVPSRPKL